MKKVIFIFICLLMLCSCEKKKNIENDSNIEKVKNLVLTYNNLEECTLNPREYYNRDGRRVYTVCIDQIMIKDTIWDFTGYATNAYDNLDDFINDITSKMTLASSFWDGGTRVYKSNDLTVITCNTIENNKDVYIGNKDLEFQDTFCKRKELSFKSAIDKLRKTEHIVYGTRRTNEKTREDDFTYKKVLNNEETKKILDIILNSEEYTGPINLPYPGHEIKFYDKEDNEIGWFAFGNINELYVEENKYVLNNFDEKELLNKIGISN